MKTYITPSSALPERLPVSSGVGGSKDADMNVYVPITHLVCDCDGVLVDSESVAYLALVDALWARLSTAGVVKAALAQAIQQRLGLTIDVLIAQVLALLGGRLTEADMTAIRNEVESAVRVRQTPIPGIAAALLAIGLPVAVASNSTLTRVREAVACSGVGAIVGDRIFTADVVGVAKPAPDIYLAACAGFEQKPLSDSVGADGAAPDTAPLPAHCLAVEDSLAGVRSAVSAGLQVLGFAGGGHIAAGPDGAAHVSAHVTMLRNAGALGVFDDMRSLPGIVAALQARATRKLSGSDVAPWLGRPALIRLDDVLSDPER